MVINAALSWIRSQIVAGYHGSRLTDVEVVSIKASGLIPLKGEDRRCRLTRALLPHPRWREVADKLDAAIQANGRGAAAGRREGQVHLTLSRAGLTRGFNHYLTHGAEFDQCVAHALLGPSRVELLAHDGAPKIIQAAVPGSLALEAAHRSFSIDDLRARGDVPNLVDEFLKAWSYRQAHHAFQPGTLKTDCGMVFRTAVPAGWIVNIDSFGENAT